jgi:hypothetical protein
MQRRWDDQVDHLVLNVGLERTTVTRAVAVADSGERSDERLGALGDLADRRRVRQARSRLPL